ncbi:PGM [Symbiodinium sp. CCMP2592]|nr:PGM [Symbiodinium sp. CCMP2592]
MAVHACLPLANCKILHFVRHAEAESNAAAHRFPKDSQEYLDAYADEKYFDSVLSVKGEAQCKELQQRIASSPSITYEAVVCSPLRRTLQTAVRVFGEEVPFIAAECAREYSQGHARPCDCRRERRLQEADFRADFSKVPEGEDTFAARPETEEELDKRCLELLQLFHTLPYQSIAVVSHTGFLTRLFAKHLRWPGPSAFSNAELRSVVVQLTPTVA